jgi:Zn-dependent protease with chaperone function
MAGMFAGLPILMLALLTRGDHPAWILWAGVMLAVLWLSLRVRGRGEPPGRSVSWEEAPRLHALVEEARLAAGIGPVNEVRLTGLPNVGVTRVFRGGILTTRPVKVVVIGLPYFRSLTVPEMESILVHEFAHFLGEDVHRGERLATIEARLGNLRRAFDRTGVLRWGNPVYLWARLYGWLFTVATASVRRKQEILADALAAETCGPIVYARALLKAASAKRLFFRLAARRVMEAAREGTPPPANLYLAFREAVRAMGPEARRRALREAREAPEPPLSTHPPLAQRLERIGRLWVPRRRAIEEKASRLVPGLEAVEEELTPATTRLVLATLVLRARKFGREGAAGKPEDAPAPVPAPPEPRAGARAAATLLPLLALLPR